ncbi:MAG: hypothetical protein QNJ00_11560 [Woeseiaceae bacterium]|nr:hypothetical protein [Woeseiaceae bacterium]
MRFLTMLVAACALALAACSSDSEDTVGKEIADDYNEAMDKAADIENQLEDKKADIDAALEEAESGDED